MIVAVVAAVHYLLLKKYVIKDWDSKGEIKDEKAVENAPTDKSEKDIGIKPQEVEKKNEKPPMEAERPLTYRNAVMGDISGIPSSREATSGILFDASSRNVLWAKNPRNAVPVASMTKIMTELLVFEALEKSDKYNMQTPIQVTRTAYKIGGSQVYLDPKETFPLEELMKCIMISSANDAAQLVAEFFGGGSVEVFVAQMNKRAKELHLSSTRFSNPTGLPANDPNNDNVSSPEAMASAMVTSLMVAAPRTA